MKLTLKIVSILLMAAVMTSLVFACGGGATPTTTPPTTTPPATTGPATTPPATMPPATTPPTITPTPKTYSYSATIFGEAVTIPADSKGGTLAPFEKTSPDGKITITFQQGTRITNADMVPYWQQISVTIDANPTPPANGDTTIIGPVVTFAPRDAQIFPAMTYRFNYASYQSQIDALVNAELKMSFQLTDGGWAAYSGFLIDTTNQTATVNPDLFVPVALVAEVPKQVQQSGGPPSNGVDLSIVSISDLNAGQTAKMTIKTVPNARVIVKMVLPKTGHISSFLLPSEVAADANGNFTWDWTVHQDTGQGQGYFLFYITTSTDPDYLKVFNAYALTGATSLQTYFPDKAADIDKFNQGLVEQLVLDDHTTLKMIPYTVLTGF